MSAPEDGLRWSEWEPRQVTTRHVQFTGFGDDGNGWEILNLLHDRGIEAYGRDGVIYFKTDEREEAIARVGYWFIDGTRSELYGIKPEVHADKYQPARR